MDSILKKERVVYCSINAVKSNIKKKKECIQKRRNKNMKHFGVSKRGKNRISLVCFWTQKAKTNRVNLSDQIG